MTTYTVTKTLIRHEDFSVSQAPETRFAEHFYDWVYTGLLYGVSASLVGTLTAGVAYVNGKRIALAASTFVFTASRDTYVDLQDDGTLVYSAVVNGAAEPSAVANAIRLCKVVTGVAGITSVVDMRRTQAIPRGFIEG